MARETHRPSHPSSERRIPNFASEDFSGAFALLAEMTEDFAASLEVEVTLERALGLIAAHVGAEGGSIWLVEENGREIVCCAALGRRPTTGARLPLDEGFIARSVRENLCQQLLDTRQHSQGVPAVDEPSGLPTRSLLCAPMSFSERPLGAVELVNKVGPGGHFAEGDVRVLQMLASSAALALVNARMAASAVEHERVRRELELAAEIQRKLLPAPQPEPFPISAANVPARTVSGDFYDILPLADGRIAFCLGDVSGKGMDAALMMAKTASLYRCLAKSIQHPGQLLGILNQELAETASRGRFVTMVAGILEPEHGIVRISNAGHEPPLHGSSNGSFEQFPAEAPPLGIAAEIVPGGAYPETELLLEGGALYLFSDGLTEAHSSSGEMLGPEGLKRLIEKFASKPLSERVAAIVSDAKRLELRDDLTLLAVSDEAP